MRKIKGCVCFLFALASIAFSGCQSTRKDIVLSGADEKAFAELEKIEETLVKLDGEGAGREKLALPRQQITALEGSVADKDFQALLAAWSGRLYLMEGRSSDAQREYRRSQNISPLNIPSQILAFRLEQDLSRRLSMIDRSLDTEGPLGELLIERARTLFAMNRFSEAVATFDAAFFSLSEKPYYREAYVTFRNKA